jgi:mediator of RNA polymerase II transcription subunit 12
MCHNLKSTYSLMQYGLEWANVITSHLKKQLGDIILPSALCPTLNTKSMFQGALADSKMGA